MYITFIYYNESKIYLPRVWLKYQKFNKSDTWKKYYSTEKIFIIPKISFVALFN